MNYNRAVQAWEKTEIKFLLNFTQRDWTDGTDGAVTWQILGAGPQLGSRTSLLTLSPQRPHAPVSGGGGPFGRQSRVNDVSAQHRLWWGTQLPSVLGFHMGFASIVSCKCHAGEQQGAIQPLLRPPAAFGGPEDLGATDQHSPAGSLLN